MTVNELIEELKKLPQDATVAVKYRDEGGLYDGVDYNVHPEINHKSYHYPEDEDFKLEEGLIIL